MPDNTTPVAPCVWPFLNKPDTRFNKDGKYRVSLVFDQDDEFPKALEAAAKEEFENQKATLKPAQQKKAKFNSPVKDEEDEEGDPTGNVMVEFQTFAYRKDKETNKIKPIKLRAYDAAGREMKKAPMVGSGSKLSIAFRPKGQFVSGGKFYYTLYLNAYQLVDLVPLGPAFGAHEGGYTHTEADTGSDFDDQTGGSVDDDDSDW